MHSANDFALRVARVAATIRAGEAAKAEGNSELASKKEEEARGAASAVAQGAAAVREPEAAKPQGAAPLSREEEARRAASALNEVAIRLKAITTPLSAGPGGEIHIPLGTAAAGQLEYRVYSAKQEGNEVSVDVYVINRGDKAVRLSDSYFRLVTDDVPLVPTSVKALVPGHSATEVLVSFHVAFSSRTGALQVGTGRGDETARIPLRIAQR